MMVMMKPRSSTKEAIFSSKSSKLDFPEIFRKKKSPAW
jgi:hypothetical protein